MNEHSYIAIMAGGSGSRLWPLSRNNYTKQFLTMAGDRSFLQMTYDRIKDIFPNDKIFIITNKKFEEIVKNQLPEIPLQNIILEPVMRDTGPAICLAANIINKIDPLGTLGTIGADHYLTDNPSFHQSIETAFIFSQKHPEGIVTIGINPTSPDTGYGYIEMSEPIDKVNKSIIFTVNSFKEKPDLDTAKKFLQNWKYLWNANYFIFNAKYLIDQFDKYLPDSSIVIKDIVKSYGNKDFKEKLYKNFEKCEKIAIDYAIMEKSKEIYVLPATFDNWIDIGNWKTMKDILTVNENQNYSNTSMHVDYESTNLMVHSDNKNLLIATLGLKDIVIISTKDALFISRNSRSHEIKKLLEKIPEEYK